MAFSLNMLAHIQRLTQKSSKADRKRDKRQKKSNQSLQKKTKTDVIQHEQLWPHK